VIKGKVMDQELDTEHIRELEEIMESEFADFVRNYISSAQTQLAEASTALNEGDSDALVRALHSLKGSSRSVAAERFAAYCGTLENKARHGKLAEVRSALTSLAGHYENVCRALNQYIADRQGS